MDQQSTGEVILYKAKDGKNTLEFNLKEDTVWLTQPQMAILFDRDRTGSAAIYATSSKLVNSTNRVGGYQIVDFRLLTQASR